MQVFVLSEWLADSGRAPRPARHPDEKLVLPEAFGVQGSTSTPAASRRGGAAAAAAPGHCSGVRDNDAVLKCVLSGICFALLWKGKWAAVAAVSVLR